MIIIISGWAEVHSVVI